MRDVSDTQSAPYDTRNTGNSANYNPLRWSGNSRQAIPCQLYQSNQPYHGYPKNNKKGIYQIDDKAMKDQPDCVHTTFDVDGKDIIYSDKGFQEVIINFIGIEISCSKCHSSFPSKLKLHKYIKAGYIGEALPFFSTQLSSSIPVIASTAVHQSFGLGLAF